MMDAWAIRHHPCDAPRRSPGLAANKKAARRFRRVTKRGTNPQHLTAPGHIGLWPMWGPYSGWNGSTSSGIWQRLRMSKPVAKRSRRGIRSLPGAAGQAQPVLPCRPGILHLNNTLVKRCCSIRKTARRQDFFKVFRQARWPAHPAMRGRNPRR